MRIKICGITRVEDALAAEEAGADAVGLIFAERSKRLVTLGQAAEISSVLGPFISRVGVFVNAPLGEVLEAARTLKLAAVQLHGQESAAYAAELRPHIQVIRAVSFHAGLDVERLQDFPADAFLIDGLQPGSGERFEWSLAEHLKGLPRFILAGGLTPENVAEAVNILQPYAVDVASGVELSPGIKGKVKIQDFVRAAKRAASSRHGPQGYPQLSTG